MPNDQGGLTPANGWFSSARRVGRRIAFWIWLVVLLLTAYAVRSLVLAFPDGPSYSLQATAEHIELRIPNSGAGFAWTGMKLRQVDSVKVECPISELLLGEQSATVLLDSVSSRTYRGDDKATPTSNGFLVTVIVNHADKPFLITCSDGTPHRVMHTAHLKPIQVRSGMTLIFFSNIKIGASPDVRGSYSNILLSGSLRATSKLHGSKQPGAVSQYDLLPGDTINLTARNERAVAAAGLLWPTPDGLHVVAQSTDTTVFIDRLGVGRITEIDLTPSTVAILQADPLCLVISAVLATALTFFPIIETYVVRLSRWINRKNARITN